MKKLLYSLFAFLILLVACSKEEQSPAPPPTPTFTLNFSADTGGTVNTEGGTYNQGSKITVTATPEGQFLFKEWSDGSTQNPREITVTSNLTLKAIFIKKTYPLSVTIDGEGTVQEQVIIQGSTTETTYNAGTTVRLTATPNEGWVFAGWSGDVESEELVIEVPIEKGTSVSALFKRDSFELNITIEGEGTVKEEVIVQPGKYDYETVVRLTAEPADGYVFSGWSGDVTSEENPIEVEMKSEINITVSFIKTTIFFPYKSPNYPSINYSSGTVINNLYSPVTPLTAEFIASKLDIIEGCDCTGCGCQIRYQVMDNNYRYFDFNNDTKPDFFGFLGDSSNGNQFNKGHYIFVQDVFNDPKIQVIEADRYFAGLSEMGDFDGDGFIEIIIFSSEDHGNNDDGSPVSEKKPLSLIDFNQNGEITVSHIGPPTSNHDLTVLDFDNDGDLDIINFEWYMYEESFHQETPLFYVNDGWGNFTFRRGLIVLPQAFYDDTPDFVRTAIDSFDLNNDGFLDLVMGWITPHNYTLNEGVQILWGTEEGIFYYDKRTELELSLDSYQSKEVLGFNFIDYNNDQYYDIVITGNTNSYSGGFIELYRNNNGTDFLRETLNKIDVSHWKARRAGGTLPIFYEFDIVDVDVDGLFDLRPANVLSGHQIWEAAQGKSIMGPNLYWKNTGGVFNLVEDFYTVDPQVVESLFDK